MLDHVREAVFNTLAPWLDGARVLDLFAGTGSLGLEALSRGARHARFVDLAREARELLEENIATVGAEGRADIVVGDALSPSSWGAESPDLVFLDPPFPMVRELSGRREVLAGVEALLTRLAPEGVIVLHVPRHALGEHELPASCVSRERIYGSQSVWFLQLDEPEEEA